MKLGLSLALTSVSAAINRASENENFIPTATAFDGAFWNLQTGVYTPGADSVGPFTSEARFLVNQTGANPGALCLSDSFTYEGPEIFCVSMGVKKSIGGNDGTCTLRMANPTELESVSMTYTWVGSVATFGAVGGVADGGGVIDLGDDWYRVYCYADVSASGWSGDSVTVEFAPYGADAVAGHGILADGVQINAGTSPSAFVYTP